MKHLFIVLTLWSFASSAINSPVLKKNQAIELPTIVRVYFEDKQQVQALSEFADIWQINDKQSYALVQIKEHSTLNKVYNMDVAIRIDSKRINERNLALEKILGASKNNRNIPGFACYSTVEETFQKMDEMVTNYPDLAEIADIGDSWEKVYLTNSGFDLRVIKLTNQNTTGDKPILFLSSAIHAREYATAELNTRFGEYLLNLYGTHPDVTWILDNHEIHLLLQTNPDGRKQAETGLLWRKNTNQDHCGITSTSRGVDLNRNYPYEWGVGSSSGEGCSDIFRGPSEGSEPEITFQMDYLNTIYDDNRGPNLNDPAPENTPGIFVDIHSYGELVLWPFGYTTSPAANDNQLQALGKRTAWFNQYRPIPVTDLVVTGGGSIDWSYGELGVASLAFELGTSFFQDCDTFEDQILPDNLEALLYLARVAQAPYIQSLGPDVETLNIVPNVIISGQTISISGIANDDRYNQSETSQSFDTVQSVAATINELPINAATSQALTATDGAFDQTSEAFMGTLNSTSMTPGKNLVYVQATDSNNKTGATYAGFVDLVDPNNVAQLSGQVTNIATGQGVPQALIEINQSSAYSDVAGQYSQLVQPGTADLVVSAEGFVSQTINALSLTTGSNVTQNIQMQPFCNIFNDDVESGDIGWQSEGTWAISTDQSVSPTHAWTDSPGAEYDDNLNISLTSPLIDLADVNTLEVSYMSLCDTEAGYDYGYFEVQFDNNAWQEISRCDNQTNWQLAEHDLNPPANTSTLKLRFRLDTDVTVTRDGWHIDDINVKASGAVCGLFNNDIIFANGFETTNK